MKRLKSNLIGVERGDIALFSDFEDEGEMWSGNGARERRKKIRFSETYAAVPTVHVTLSLWDIDSAHNVRAEVVSEKVTKHGFDLVFRTWGDTRVARVRMSWMSIGELPNEDNWELY